MKNLYCTIVFIAVFFSNNLHANTDTLDVDLMSEMSWFIKEIKAQGNDYTNRFVVYILYESSDISDETKRCYTMGYIMNSFEINNYKTKTYFKLDGEFILFLSDFNTERDKVQNIPLEKLDTDTRIKLAQKLYPEVIGAYTYNAPGVVYCLDTDGFKKEYYDFESEIPRNFSIYKFSNIQYEIKLIDSIR